MADPLLSVFPPALLRLVLCGGGGLPAAWGPLADQGSALAAWHPHRAEVFDPGPWQTALVMQEPHLWRLPLDHWRARLAVVAGHFIGFDHTIAARIESTPDAVFLSMWTPELGGMIRGRAWNTLTGGGSAEPDLPTLPARLLTHDPHVALLLALFDVPEIRARLTTD